MPLMNFPGIPYQSGSFPVQAPGLTPQATAQASPTPIGIGVDRGAVYHTTAQPAQTRFIPWTGAMPQTAPSGLSAPATGPAATTPLGASATPRFIAVPRTQTGQRFAPTGQGQQSQGPDLASLFGLGIGGLNTGMTGLNLANQAGGLGLNLGPYQQALGGLTGGFNLAQGIRMDDPFRAIGGGLQAANSLSGLAGGPTISSLLKSAGLSANAASYVVPGIGAALGIIQNALAGNVEPEKQAFDASLAVAAAAFAPATGGLSLLAPIMMELGGPLFGEKDSIYDAKRSSAAREGMSSLSGISGAIQGAAAKFVETGNLGDALQGLQTHFGGPRNPVKSALFIPLDAAQAAGITPGPGMDVIGGNLSIGWDQMSPQQFQQVLARMAAEPDQGLSWVRGSGDIGYLSQAQAINIGAEVKAQTDDYLHFLMVATGLVPNTPWESRYAPFAKSRADALAEDARLMDERNLQFQNPEFYHLGPQLGPQPFNPYDGSASA